MNTQRILSGLLCLLPSVLLFFRCSSRNEKDPTGVNNFPDANASLLRVSIDVNYYSQRTLNIRATIENERGAIFSDSTDLLVDGERMHYSVGVGNYYERYPHYSIAFEDSGIPKDTLKFSVQLKDNTVIPIGYVSIATLARVVDNERLTRDVMHDKKKSLLIDWGGPEVDEVQIYRQYYYFEDGARTFSGGPNDSTTISRHWSVHKPVQLHADYFVADTVSVYALHVSWTKMQQGVITNKQISGSITARCEMQQQIILEKIEY